MIHFVHKQSFVHPAFKNVILRNFKKKKRFLSANVPPEVSFFRKRIMLLGFVLGSKRFLFWLFMVPPSKPVVWMYFLHQYRSAVHQWQVEDVFTSVNTSAVWFPSFCAHTFVAIICLLLFYFILLLFHLGCASAPHQNVCLPHGYLLVKYLLFLLHKWDLCHTGRNGVGKWHLCDFNQTSCDSQTRLNTSISLPSQRPSECKIIALC